MSRSAVFTVWKRVGSTIGGAVVVVFPRGVCVDGHRALVADLLTVVDLRDWAKLAELVTDDVVYNRPGYPPLCGRGELVEFYRSRHIVVNGRHQVDRILCGDGEGFCWGRFDGVSHSGVPLSETFAEWFAFRGGLVWRRRTFFYRPAV